MIVSTDWARDDDYRLSREGWCPSSMRCGLQNGQSKVNKIVSVCLTMMMLVVYATATLLDGFCSAMIAGERPRGNLCAEVPLSLSAREEELRFKKCYLLNI